MVAIGAMAFGSAGNACSELDLEVLFTCRAFTTRVAVGVWLYIYGHFHCMIPRG